MPGNVRFAVNLYQRSVVLRGFPLRGKRVLVLEDPASTEVLGNLRIRPQATRFGWNWNLVQPLFYRQHIRIGHDVRLQDYLIDVLAISLAEADAHYDLRQGGAQRRWWTTAHGRSILRCTVPTRTEVTELLHQWSDGRGEALDELFPLLYRELHGIAAAQLRREFGRRSLQATELVNEAYLKLVPRRGVHLASRAQFMAIAARAMRALLVDRARARNAAKRGGPGGDAVLQIDPASLPPGADLLDLDDALVRLARVDRRQSRIVELKYFGGLTLEEIASVLQISPATVSREWTHAKAWLYAELKT